MRYIILKSALMLILAAFSAVYITGCSSAEQTTGKLAYSQGDYEKAEKEFLKESQQNPANEEAWFYLSMSRFHLNKIDAAETALKQYKSIGKNSYNSELIQMWNTKYNQGVDAVENGKTYASDTTKQLKLYREAIDDFRAALILIPDSTDAKKNIDVINNRIAIIKVKPFIDQGAALINEGKYEEASNQFRSALSVGLEKDNPAYETLILDISIAYTKWALEFQQNENTEQAKEKYKLALPYLEELKNTTNKSNKLAAYQLLVPTYAYLGMTDQAKEALQIRDQLQNENK